MYRTVLPGGPIRHTLADGNGTYGGGNRILRLSFEFGVWGGFYPGGNI
jgi:hypothetical protein